MPSGRFISFVLAFLISGTSLAQSVKSFSGDPVKFPAEAESLLSDISSPTIVLKIRELILSFTENWEAGVFNDEEKAIIISNANILLERKLKPYPNLYQYISIVHNLKNKGNKPAVLIWCQDFQNRIPAMTQRRIESYLNQYESLAHNNILYESSTFNWYCSDTAIYFEYDTAIRVIYRNVDVTCATRKDTSVIFSTSGMFYPGTYKWTGRKGRVTWEKVGLSPDSVFADLSHYEIIMKLAEYEADTVTFINKKYFKTPLYGKVVDKIQATAPGPTSTYPQFISYLKNYEIRNLFKDIDYQGGFSVEGPKVIGTGEVNENATILIYRDGKVKVRIRANAFRIRGDQISANPASISIFIDSDSVFHPGMQMNYFADKRRLEMFRPESGLSESPFFDGFHEIDMDCGALYWQLDSDTINFESVPGINRTSKNEFISKNYFSEYDFYRIQGIDEKNPLYIIRDFAKTYGTDVVSPSALAQYMRKPVEQIKAMLLKLSIQGLLYYDLINDRAIIQDRLYEYIDAKSGKRDYDVITINSETNNISNATLDLENYDLVLRGVEQVFLSDSQKVFIYPDNDEIVIKKGLDITFSGNVSAGLFDFYAHDCSFEYDSFKLNIPLIDSLSFRVKSFTENERGERPLVRVKSVIENLSGKLQIDDPLNKSGLKTHPEYPIFYSEQESFVYYDHDPLYDRERFAYHIFPFVIDSLDNFSTENLSFDGYLASAGIFPDIEEPLKVQKDYSLGFINYTPEDGYPAYADSGRFYDEVALSNRGLRGSGQLKFLTSQTHADDFHFYPDSMITDHTHRFTIEPMVAAVEYPGVKADTIYQVWYPYRDTMHLKTIRQPMKMYDGKSLLTGDLYYSSGGLSGKGKVGFENVELASEKYIFKRHTIDADTLDFRLFTAGTSDLAVSAEKYRTHVDFETRMVEFRTNEKGSTVSFPYNSYVCYMDNIDWYMDQHEMKLYNDLGEQYANLDQMSREELLTVDLSGSDFLATDPKADSLSFFSATARYDLIDYIIDAQGVRLIRAADAAIFPDSGFVKISRGGQIQPLKNSSIIADTANRFHTMERTEVTIQSRHNFQAKGTYQYYDTTGVLQEFPLSLISVDSTGRTFAQGSISEKLDFSMNPYFDFRGNVSFTSVRKELMFEGGFRTHDDCFGKSIRNWVYFKSWIDPDNVRIPVTPPLVDIDGNPIELAIQISDYEEEIYASWFTAKAGPGDTSLVAPSGEIYYDEPAMAYKITGRGQEASLSGQPSFTYFTRNCSMEATGPIGLGLDFNYVKAGSYGDVMYLVVPDSASFNLTLTFDFLFYEGCLSIMADSLSKSDLKGLDITRKEYFDFLDYSLSKADAKDLKEDIRNYGKVRRLPDELIHQIVLTDVNMYWNSVTNSYISRGPIGVLSVGKDPINRYTTGHLELLRRRSGDVISLYLEISPMQYYFFDYRNGIMQALSSDNEFNNRINETKQEKRTLSIPGLDETYEFLVATNRRMIDFLRRMEPFN
jgi:hypothetical protein